MSSVSEMWNYLHRDLNEENDSYTVNKKNDSKFEVVKSDGTTYYLEKKQQRWQCTCTGFKYRGKCKHLDLIKEHLPKRHERAVITNAIKDILPELKKITPRVEIVGSYRRGSKDSKDIDIIMDCSATQFKKVNEVLQSYENFESVMSGDSIIRGFCNGIEMDINRLGEGMNYYLALEYRTGPADHNIAMRALAKKLNGSLSENELVVNGYNIRVSSEKDIYDALGVKYQEPTKRSKDLVMLPVRNLEQKYKAYIGNNCIGSAASRMYAKDQLKKLRDILKNLPKKVKTPVEWEGVNVDVRFVCTETELVSVSAPFIIKSPLGDIIPCNQYQLDIRPVVKLNGKIIQLTDEITVAGHKVTAYQYYVDCIQKEINQKLKLNDKGTATKCSIELTQELKPLKITFRSVPFPVENVRS